MSVQQKLAAFVTEAEPLRLQLIAAKAKPGFLNDPTYNKLAAQNKALLKKHGVKLTVKGWVLI